MVLSLLTTAHAARVLLALDRLGKRSRFTPLRNEAAIGDQQLTRALKFLNTQGHVAAHVVAEGDRAPMEYRLTRLGAEALDVLRAWHQAVHGKDSHAARAADQEFEALGV